jgi:hypothetical protein
MQTSWKISLLANSTALAVSALLGIWYSHHKMKTTKDDNQIVSGWDYPVVFVLVALGAFLSYLITYVLFGYVPMSKITGGIIRIK